MFTELQTKMDKDKIKEFWLKSAEAKHMTPLEAAKHDFNDLQALQQEYMEFLASVNPEKIEAPKAAELEVPWREVLMFLQNTFAQMDANEAEPDHAEATAFRKIINCDLFIEPNLIPIKYVLTIQKLIKNILRDPLTKIQNEHKKLLDKDLMDL